MKELVRIQQETGTLEWEQGADWSALPSHKPKVDLTVLGRL